MDIQAFHHVAYRCKDAKETVDFYGDVVGLPYTFAVAENSQPSTGEKHPYMHIFFELADGSFLAFFELPEDPPMGQNPNSGDWAQHIAFKVADMETLQVQKKRIEEAGIKVLGPIDHKICQSIYFHDPNGHRLEYAVDTATPDMVDKLVTAAPDMLEDWSKTKKAPHYVDWVHEDAHKAHQ